MATSPAALAHPFDDGPPVLLDRSVEHTATMLGADAEPYRRLMDPVVRTAHHTMPAALAPLLRIPAHPLALARFGLRALPSGKALANRFSTMRAKGLMAGLAAHSVVPLNRMFVGGVAMSLAIAGHIVGWPVAVGGSVVLAEPLAGYLKSLDGTIETGRWVRSLDELPESRAVLLDVTPHQFLEIAGDRLRRKRRKDLERWTYGPAVFKLDLAVNQPIPWRDDDLRRAATVHLGGTYREIATAEWEAWKGTMSERPFVLLNQPTLFDPSRAPEGMHTVWTYTHVPAGWDGDATEIILRQIERFAPGFRDTIIGMHAMGPADYERYNPNNVGGAIGGGAITVGQMIARPRLSPDPYATGIDDVYLCSSSTPPGAGTHGMCGFHAANSALRRTFQKRVT